MGDGVYVENQLNAYDRERTGCYHDYKCWTGSADACFRDLIPEAESRGCTWQIQSISGHPGYAQAVFLLPESSGLTYNLSDHTIAPDEDDVDAEYARLEQRIRDAIDLVPRAICLAWLGSKRS